MFASYPGQIGDRDAAMRAYLDEVSDIPVPWLRAGLARFRDEPDRTYLASIAEVRTAVAKSVQRIWREARGIDQRSASSQSPIDVAACLKIGREYPRGPEDLLAAGRAQGPMLAATQQAPQVESGPRGESAGEALGQVLGGLRTDEGYTQMIARIWDEGLEVPARSHPDKAHSMQGYCIASALARMRTGQPAVSAIFNSDDWKRYDRTMERHRADGGDCAWWDEIKAEWARRARP